MKGGREKVTEHIPHSAQGNGLGVHNNWAPETNLRVLQPTKKAVSKVLGKYERDFSLAPVKVPLADIHTNLEKFQLRKSAYSKASVAKMICAIKERYFFKELFGPINLRHNEEENKLYIIWGHSRAYFYSLLANPEAIDNESGLPLRDHPNVQDFMKAHKIDFKTIPAHIFTQMDINDAEFIASISNTLGTLESVVDRAFAYNSMRRLKWVTDEELVKRFSVNEWKWRHTVLALSHLNPHGKAIQTLDSFEGNDDAHKDITKVCKRIGETRRKYLALSDLHETELFERMVEKWGYGVEKKWQGAEAGKIFKQSTFLQVVGDHITKLEKKGKFKPDLPLNILNKREFSYARQQFEKLLAAQNKIIRASVKEREQVEEKSKKVFIAMKKGEITQEIGEKELWELNEDFVSLSNNIMQMKLDLDEAQEMRFKYKGRDKEMLKAAQQKLLIERVNKESVKESRARIIGELENQSSLLMLLQQSVWEE